MTKKEATVMDFLALLIPLVLVIFTGMSFIYWAAELSRDLGFRDFAYGLVSPFTWIAGHFYQAVLFASIFSGVFWSNCSIDYLTGEFSNHLFFDACFSGIAAIILFWAMIIEGMRRRRRYYEHVVPLRRSYRRFPSKLLIRPPFWELYRMW